MGESHFNCIMAKNIVAFIDGTISKLEMKKGAYSADANA